MSFHFSLMRAFYFRLQNRSPKSLSFFVDQLATQRLRSLLDLRLNLRAGDYSSHLPHLYVRLKCFAPMSRIAELTTSKPSTSSSSMASLFGDSSIYGRCPQRPEEGSQSYSQQRYKETLNQEAQQPLALVVIVPQIIGAPRKKGKNVPHDLDDLTYYSANLPSNITEP
ncbi:unnamed protein product [Ilex paraguariensis]|uniref:Uncharacterized protein n=1 Tax=Ilex paraguariensis TaxID=185542 RepID=A0ABC8RMS4_9AQUA